MPHHPELGREFPAFVERHTQLKTWWQTFERGSKSLQEHFEYDEPSAAARTMRDLARRQEVQRAANDN